MSSQLAQMMAAARQRTDHAHTRQEYTLVKTMLQHIYRDQGAVTSAVRQLSLLEPFQSPMCWFYDTHPGFPYQLILVSKEDRIPDLLYNTGKTAAYKRLLDQSEPAAVVTKPHDYAAFVVLHNIVHVQNFPLPPKTWRAEIQTDKGTMYLQTLTSLLASPEINYE
jgi:hypothetical protein